jgi:hypothetical protein
VTNGQIDTTTVYGAIAALSSPSPDQTFSWAWENAQELLAALIMCGNLHISPVPTPHGQPLGDLGRFVEMLSFAVRQQEIPKATIQHAEHRTARWARKSYERVAGVLSALQSNTEPFESWAKWHVDHEWPDRLNYLGNLTDSRFDTYVALAIDVPIHELQGINQRVARSTGLRSIINSADLNLAINAWAASILIRGVYYYYLAEMLQEHYVFHQVRQECLPKTRAVTAERVESTPAEIYLFHLLLASTFREHDIAGRMKTFAELAKKGRDLVANERLKLDQTYPEAALGAAVSAAQSLFDLTLSPKWVEPAVEIAAATIAGGISYFLQPWMSPLVSVITSELLTYPPGKLSAFSSRKCHTETLEFILSFVPRNRAWVLLRTIPSKGTSFAFCCQRYCRILSACMKSGQVLSRI